MLVAIFKSLTLSGERGLFPVIITYFAGWKLAFSLGLNVRASIRSVGDSLKRDRTDPALVKPSSSNARAIGTRPPSMYCEYIRTTPVEFII